MCQRHDLGTRIGNGGSPGLGYEADIPAFFAGIQKVVHLRGIRAFVQFQHFDLVEVTFEANLPHEVTGRFGILDNVDIKSLHQRFYGIGDDAAVLPAHERGNEIETSF